MKFTKMEGTGNDFVVFDGPLELDPELRAALCDRRRGIGADGVLIVSPVDSGRVRMEYFNADGAPAEMCGNGLRCVALRAVALGLVEGQSFIVDTPIGARRVDVAGPDRIRVELGPIEIDRADAEVGGYSLCAVSVGNPHAVLFVDDPATVDVAGIGGTLATHPAFPQGTNVEFVAVDGSGSLRMRVWERGVGETMACGTGAAAVVMAAHARGRSESSADVELPGGTLHVEILDGVAWLTGPARVVFSGSWIG